MKPYREGDAVEFKSQPGLERWMPGIYVEPDKTFNGWHWVKGGTWGERFIVPSRRLRFVPKKAEGGPESAI